MKKKTEKPGAGDGQKTFEANLNAYSVNYGSMLDLGRMQRLGFPEVVYAGEKPEKDLLEIIGAILDKGLPAFVSAVDQGMEKFIREHFQGIRMEKGGRLMVIGEVEPPERQMGRAALITAGTSDIPYAEECFLLLKSLGVRAEMVHDVGVAGIHRAFAAFEHVGDADVLVVFAGMEGMLPILMASLSDRPVIGVPTPVGYGMGGKGVGALSSMLQSCVPGLMVVNIGNSVGAAAGAVRILNAQRRDSGG
ncbi:MAG: nickel pincer cofactor biosynthesis protein LarB [Thermodesulfobacteriota bacterium]|nr:nickel pincer cofactor biosynthesis protein LarB [Thermodesulfobacteriota bacterium]